jgi:uncharacterized OsmC-like protein
MEGTDRVKRAFERNAKALTLRPSLGQGTAVTKVRLKQGLACEIEEGPWKLVADMGEKSGGQSEGPNPGILGRAALGSCLAMNYAMYAAKNDIPIDGIEVEIQADYDACGHYGVADVTPAYSEVRYIVSVETSAPEEDVIRLLDEADKYTSYLAVFAEPQSLRREIRITSRKV